MTRSVLLLWLCAGAQGGWVDPDTPVGYLGTRSLVDDSSYSLVFSDEFEVEGRRFRDGEDPRWTAIHKNDYTNDALHYYHEENAMTTNGVLNVTTSAEETQFTSIQVKHDKVKKKELKKNFRSGMIQSWNKFCFTGGIMEIRAQLPGDYDKGGLWPAAWLMGNLARSTYVASSDYMWPWSYDFCDRRYQRRQEVSACDPKPHFGLDGATGRGAPEIDLLEVMPGTGYLPWGMTKPYVSTSLQVAPGKEVPRPANGDRPHPGQWYGDSFLYGPNTSINVFFYGLKLEHPDTDTSYQADALSANTGIDQSFFEEMHTYRLEWEPLEYLRWYIDDNFVYGIDNHGLNDTTHAKIPDEPSYILFNTAMSTTWGFPMPCPKGCKCNCYACNRDEKCTCAMAPGFCETLPAHYLVDYVRVYQRQDREDHKVGCSTDSRPTKKFILAHADRYRDPDKEGSKPLLHVRNGGGTCRQDSDCGPEGKCRGIPYAPRALSLDRKTCVCSAKYTGPLCLAFAAKDDVDYDAITMTAKGVTALRLLYVPPAIDRVCLTFAALLLVILATRLVRVKRKRREKLAVTDY